MNAISAIRIVLASLSIAILAVAPAFATLCSGPAVKMSTNQTQEYVLEACPSYGGESEFEVLEYGNDAIAKVVFTRGDGDDGVFTITSVAPGETKIRLQWVHTLPRRMGICTVKITVTEV